MSGDSQSSVRPGDGTPLDTFLVGSAEMGELYRSLDWPNTAFGALAVWPQSLRTTMSIALTSRFPIAVYWGPDFLMLYNESLVPMVGPSKHPQALGQPARIVLAEIWGIIEPLLRHVRDTGEATWSENLMLPLARTGTSEESYFTFTYSPIRDESGGVGGVFCAAVETTDTVIEGRRLRLLNALAEAARAPTPVQACAHAATKLEQASIDVPFALLYLFDDAGVATLAGTANMVAGSPLAPSTIASDAHAPWPLAQLGDQPCFVPLVAADTGARGAMILPLAYAGGGQRFGFLVTGLSPLLAQSESYTRFHTLLAASISQGVSSAAAYEEERKRADALAELDRAKTEFFSNVSHEFRTPLTLLIGPAEDALNDGRELSDDDRERWSLVHRNALRLSRLVNTLLDFSRIEAGRIDASYEPTDLSKLTAELASMFRSSLDRCGLALKLELLETAEPAYVDRSMWEKIVLNLLSNALKFTFDGEIAVAIRVVDDSFELTIRDTGIGIAESELPHVFDRFHRIKGARARTHEGSGIGLALVAELAKLHGGSTRVESVAGSGTTFFVRVPRGARHLAQEQLIGAPSVTSVAMSAAPYLAEARHWNATATTTKRRIKTARRSDRELSKNTAPRARIVLADDNADMRDYVSRLLEARWQVEAVADGNEALQAIRVGPPDLVITDMMMPQLDGFGLIAALRADPALRLTPVILLSARAGDEATAEGLRAGADDYIVKPFSARELIVRVESALMRARAAREAREIEEASRARLYSLFMQTPFPVAVLQGPQHVVELANPLALAAWGKDASLVGKVLIDGMPELRGQPFLGYLDEVRRTGVAYQAHGELARLVRKDGKLEDAYWDFVYAPLRDSTGAVQGVLVSGFEVTAQVRAAQELTRLLAQAESSERQLRDFVENMPELAWTARPDGFIDYYNQRWYEYTGTTLDEMQGWGWTALHDPTLLEAVTDRWKHSLATGEPFEMEFPLKGADGEFRWFLVRVRPLRDREGRIVRWFGSNTNIDARRRSETFQEIFLGVLGHDLRNPLSTILMAARLLGMDPQLPAALRKNVVRVETSGLRMQRMIEQLLDLTRARLAGGIPVQVSPTAVDLSALVAKIVDEIRAAHPASHIELATMPGCFARIDADRIEQVMSNLLGNAIAHGDPQKPIVVNVSAQRASVNVSVQNHGAAIDPAFLPLLFNPFARAQNTSSARSTGLGLGLYISEQIVTAHHGKIAVQSSVEGGTRVEVTLPTG